jgi:hypothetical protein
MSATMTRRLVQRINDSGMTIIGGILERGLMPPLEVVRCSREAFANNLDDTDPDFSEKKTVLRDLDEIIYNIEHGQPRFRVVR